MLLWKSLNRFWCVVCCFLLTPAVGEQAYCEPGSAMPKQLRRADSFFGIHFDLHANEHDDRIGEKVTRQPANRTFNCNYSVGKITLTLPHLQIHDIIVVE